MGLSVNVRWENARLVRKGLEDLRRELPRIARARIYEFLRQVYKRMRRYPGKPPGSTYVRTYKLKKAWRIRRAGNMAYVISNRASFKGRVYSTYVHGDDAGTGQARVHRGRWPILLNEMLDRLEKLPKAVADNAHTIVRRYWDLAR